MSSRAIEAGRAFVRIIADDTKFSAGMTKCQKKLEDFAIAGRNVASNLALGSAAATAAIAYMTKSYADAGFELQNMASKSDMSVEYLSKMGHAVKAAGIEINDFVDANKDLSKNFAEAAAGNQGMIDTFESIGVSIQSLKGLNAEQRFAAIAEALSRVPDHAQRSAVAMKLMGDNGFKMLPMLSGGVAGIEEALRQAKDAGAEWTTQQAADAAAMKKSLDEIYTAATGVANSFVAAAAPAVLEFLEQVKSAIPHITKWIENNKDLVSGGAAVAGVGMLMSTAFVGVVQTALSASTAVGALGKGYDALSRSGLSFAKGGIILGATVAIGAAFVTAEGSVAKFNETLEKTAELSQRIEKINKGKNADRLSKIGGVGHAESRARMLRAEQTRLQKELSGNQAGLKGSQRQYEATKTWGNFGRDMYFGSITGGSADKKEASQQVTSDRAAVAQTEAALQAVNDAIKQADSEMAALGQARLDEQKRLSDEEKAAYEKAIEDERQAAERAADELERELDLLAEKVMTPVEKMSREMARYQELFDSGLIDKETFDRAAKMTQIDTGAGEVKSVAETATNAAAVQQGSQEAFSAIVRSMSGSQQSDQQIASNTRAMVAELQKLNRAPVQKITIKEV